MGVSELRPGSSVAFRLGDAFLPELSQILAQIGPQLVLSGEVVFFSDRGSDEGHFAIVSVAGIDAPLIVPVASLNAITGLRIDVPIARAEASQAQQ